MENELVRRNVTPRRKKVDVSGAGVEKIKAWDTPDARKILAAAKKAGPQTAAFIELALDSGARKGELQGFRWTDVDLQAGTVRIVRQLLKGGTSPLFGPTKTRNVRSVNLSAETVTALREHKKTQSELKLANRLHYADHGLVFAQAWEHQNGRNAKLGTPLPSSAITAMLERLITATAVPRITVHGLRHTSATLSLKAGTPAHVVQRRLGHRSIQTTLNLYAHALPSMQEDAATRLAALRHG